MTPSPLTTCFWFDTRAEEAANFYVSLFPDSKITGTQKYSHVGSEWHKKEPGTVMTVDFEIKGGHRFTAANGGATSKPNEDIVGLEIECEDQAEVDYYWRKLCEGGDEAKQGCGWCADKFGVSWHVVPKAFKRMCESTDDVKRDRVLAAMFTMKKLDLAELTRAFEGTEK